MASLFPLPSGEGQGEGALSLFNALTSLTPTLSQRERVELTGSCRI